MASNLVIVESPAKARTITKILGNDYLITASMGHVRDLPEQGLGVDIKNDFAPTYIENKDKGKVIRELRAAAKKASTVYLAPDPDREGEAIAWHLRELLKPGTKAVFRRVTFHEITKNAVAKAFEKPGEVDMNRVDSQQARRILDRLVGYQVSRLLWTKVERGASAGRVQSVALRLVCEREREILGFVPREYWNLLAELELLPPGSGKTFTAKLAGIDGGKADIDNADKAAAAGAAIKAGAPPQVASVEVKPVSRRPPPPFITSTLQQAASGGLGFSANQTMRIAQQLYEGVDIPGQGPTGLITYMRTDSVNLAAEAVAQCRSFIADEFGKDYMPASPNRYKSKASAQEAHEAIRPTDVHMTPEKAKPFLDARQHRLYEMIWKRFVACQMAPARQSRTTVDTAVVGSDRRSYLFRATATVTLFPGYMKLVGKPAPEKDDEDGEGAAEVPAAFAELRKGDTCHLKDLASEQKFTEPPPRFSEATLIRELEANGIGRPSTYASIVNTIQTRDYTRKEKGLLTPTELGFKVNDYLVESLPDLFQVGFTAEMETRLDAVEEGKLKWTKMLEEFYRHFAKWLDILKDVGSAGGDKAAALFAVFEQVKKWAEPVKRGRRTYDDAEFLNSLKEKFDQDGKITANQWSALLKMASRYQQQLPDIAALASKQGFADEWHTINTQETAAADERQERAERASGVQKETAALFAAFAKVEWAPATKRGARVYDDKKFFDSLRKQFEEGKAFSDKQLNALSSMLGKYKDQVPAADALLADIGVTAPAATASPESNREADALLAQLAKVGNWAEPSKKGRRTFDDKEFFDSLSRQRREGRTLSPRQVAALKKLVGKYEKKE